MFHLPKDGARVRVWPDPKRPVVSGPSVEGSFSSLMPASGTVVEWDAFRYRQYLEGQLHFFDPRDPKDPSRRNDPPMESDHEDFLHEPELPQHIVDELKKVALKDGAGVYLDDARKDEIAEHEAMASKRNSAGAPKPVAPLPAAPVSSIASDKEQR